MWSALSVTVGVAQLHDVIALGDEIHGGQMCLPF